MSAHGPDPSMLLPMVGDIVERNVLPATSPQLTKFTTTNTTIISNSTVTEKSLGGKDDASQLRPIQAVVGQAFPPVLARRSYGRRSTQAQQEPPSSSTLTAPERTDTPSKPRSVTFHGLSAHVQPQDGAAAAANGDGGGFSTEGARMRVPDGGDAPVLPAGGSTQQHLQAHQWSVAEFEGLRGGYYVAPVPHNGSAPLGTTTTSTAPAAAASVAAASMAVSTENPPTGEDFFRLLFQCLRSTVRKHQQLALEVLLAHLRGIAQEDQPQQQQQQWRGETNNDDDGDVIAAAAATMESQARVREEAVALRERCLHGPNCGPFLFFVLEVLVSARHPAVTELAATCLLLLLRDVPRGSTSTTTTGGGEERVNSVCASVSLLTEAISELGNPAGDAPGEEDDDDATNDNNGGDADAANGTASQTPNEHTAGEERTEGTRDDPELPFSDVSELLRGADARYGLEQLGFTNKVLAALQPLVLHPASATTTQSSDNTAATVEPSVPSPSSPSSSSFPSSHLNIERRTDAAAAASLPGPVLFLELLLCGGVGIRQRAACRRVAGDPAFLAWVEAQLSEVVLGQRPLDSITELLCVLQHLAHVLRALHSLLRGGPAEGRVSRVAQANARDSTGGTGSAALDGAASTVSAAHHHHHIQQQQQQRFHETWLLFFLYVCSTAAKEVRTVRQVGALVWSMLFLRACVRQTSSGSGSGGGAAAAAAAAAAAVVSTSAGPGYGLVHDLSEALLSEGMAVGGAMVLEMWLLQYIAVTSDAAAGAAGQPSSLDTYFFNVAQAALHMCQRPAASQVSGSHGATTEMSQSSSSAPPSAVSSAEAAAAQGFLRCLQWTTSTHFLASYLAGMRRRGSLAVCFTLCGSAVATQETMKEVVRSVLMDSRSIQSAFARLTSPLLSPHFSAAATATTVVSSSRQEGKMSACADVSAPQEGLEGTVDVAAADTYSTGWQEAVQAVLQRWHSPLRSNSHSSAPSPPHSSSSSFSSAATAVLQLTFEAAALYANVRAAFTIADTVPAVAHDLVVGYAAMLTNKYAEACLRLRDSAAVRLQVDELSTMAEAVRFLQRFGYGGGDGEGETSQDRSEVGVGAGAGDTDRALDSRTFTAMRSSNAASSSSAAPERGSSYRREARMGAFFLLHSIAISKHCLDVVQLTLPLLLLDERTTAAPHGSHTQTLGRVGGAATTASTTAAAATEAANAVTKLTLLASLQEGVERTPVPVMVSTHTTATGREPSSSSSPSSAVVTAHVLVTGAPRSWVLYPLYDRAFSAKQVWARWLRGLLGLHRRVKDVLGWDALLSHTLLWTLTHRRALWSPRSLSEVKSNPSVQIKGTEQGDDDNDEEEGEAVDATSADGLCALLLDLCGVLHDQTAPLSAAAARTLEVSLTAYTDAPSEDGLPLCVHGMVAYVAARSSAKVALAALQLLLTTPVLSTDRLDTTTVTTTPTTATATDSLAVEVGSAAQTWLADTSTPAVAGADFSYSQASQHVLSWLRTWAEQPGQPRVSSTEVHWGLDAVVALLQLVGPHLNNAHSAEAHWDSDQEWMGHADGQWEEEEATTTAAAAAVAEAAVLSTTLECVRCLTDGVLRAYVLQRRAVSGALSAMEKTVLRSTLEELDWCPAVLWPHVTL